MLFFTLQNILSPLQHGFRPNHSYQTQLIDFTDEIQWSMNDRQQTDLIFIDSSKVFDMVPHMRLLNKLKFYGIRGRLHHWILAWLTRREQRVVVDECYFSQVGLPQGTVLGPLMFLVYINDINENIRSSVWLFADDCVIYKPIRTLQDAEDLQICDWICKNQTYVIVHFSDSIYYNFIIYIPKYMCWLSFSFTFYNFWSYSPTK